MRFISRLMCFFLSEKICPDACAPLNPDWFLSAGKAAVPAPLSRSERRLRPSGFADPSQAAEAIALESPRPGPLWHRVSSSNVAFRSAKAAPPPLTANTLSMRIPCVIHRFQTEILTSVSSSKFDLQRLSDARHGS